MQARQLSLLCIALWLPPPIVPSLLIAISSSIEGSKDGDTSQGHGVHLKASRGEVEADRWF